MTPQERQLVESLAARIANTPPPQKDAEADQMIQERIGSRPDALYLLAQTVLIQEMALNQANGRLHDLQEQLNAQQGQQAQPHTSFLGRLFGGDPRQPQYAQPQYGQPPYGQPPQYAQTQYAPQQYAQPQYATAPPSFLRSAATTATGVAAGALAFEGIEALLHGFGGGGFGGGYGGGGGETIVNNYYDEPRGGGESHGSGFLDNGQDVSNADYDSSSDDSSGSGDSSYDSSGDDSSGGDSSV